MRTRAYWHNLVFEPITTERQRWFDIIGSAVFLVIGIVVILLWS